MATDPLVARALAFKAKLAQANGDPVVARAIQAAELQKEAMDKLARGEDPYGKFVRPRSEPAVRSVDTSVVKRATAPKADPFGVEAYKRDQLPGGRGGMSFVNAEEVRGEVIDIARPATPEDTWAETGQKVLSRAIPGFKASIGGAVQGVIETATNPAAALPGIGLALQRLPAFAEAQRKVLDNLFPDGVPGAAMSREATEELKQNEFRPGDNQAKYYIGMLGDSLIQMAPSFAAAIATRNPGLATGIMGAQVAGQQYGESRNERGRSISEATQDAVYMAAAEMLGEKIVLGKILEPTGGDKLLGRILKSAGMEGAQEMLTQSLQTGYQAGVLKDDMTLGQALKQVMDAGIVGAGMGGAMQAAAAPFNPKPHVPGEIEAAQSAVAPLSEEDRASPLPDDVLQAGYSAVAQGAATDRVDTALAGAGLPRSGSRVSIIAPDGSTQRGVVSDIFKENGEDKVRIAIDGGGKFEEFLSDVTDSGYSIAEAPELAPLPQVAEPIAAAPIAKPVDASATVEGYMAKTRGAESGGNDRAKNPRSSATGRYQFTDGTWLATYAQEFGDTGESPAQILAKRGDGEVQDRLMRRLTESNAAALRKAGHEVTDGNLYLAHFAGSGGANALLGANPEASAESVLGAAAVRANPFLKDMTAADVVAWAAKKMGAPAPVAGVPVSASSEPTGPDWLGEELIANRPREEAPAIAAEAPAENAFTDMREAAQAAPASDVRGDKIDDEWTNFRPESGTLAIPRADMPQIAAENRGAMVNFLKARGIEHKQLIVPATDLKPTQAEFSEAKVQKAKEYEGGNRAILTSSDGYVVDGHHQWMAARDDGAEIRTIRLNAPIAELLNTVREMPTTLTESGEQPVEVATTAPAPVSTATVSEQPSGKSIIIKGASEEQLAAVAAAIPNAKPMFPASGGVVYSKKYETKVREALDAPVAREEQGPSITVSDTLPGGMSVEEAAVVARATQAARLTPAERAEYAQLQSDNRNGDIDDAGMSRMLDLAAKLPATGSPPVSDEEHNVIWRDKAFKQALKDIGSAPHRESEVAGSMTRGWRDGQAANLAELDRQLARVRQGDSAYRPNGFNPAQGYIEAFHAAVTGNPIEVRAIGESSKFLNADEAVRRIKAELDTPPSAGGPSGRSVAAGSKVSPTDQATTDLLTRMVEAEDAGRRAPIDSGTLRVQMMIREGLLSEGQGDVAYVVSDKGRALIEGAVEKAAGSKPDQIKSAPKTPGNRLVSDDRAAILRARLKEKLNLNRLNSGIDPEVLAIGAELAVYHIESGARRFTAFAKAVAADLGTEVSSLRAYLRSWYNGARDMMEDAGHAIEGMDGPDAVSDAMRDFDKWGQSSGAVQADASAAAGAGAGVPVADPAAPVDAVRDHFLAGNGFATITEARKFIAELTGEPIKAGTPEAKRADETIEAAVVQAARSIAARERPALETYRELVALYGRQPNLAVRSSTSVEQQAYSTPVPLAYLASQRAGIDQNTTVYEPTAGNGALLIDARATYVTANELNRDRAAQLRAIYRGAKVSNEDATSFKPQGKQDVVIANPPFGVLRDADGDTISYNLGDGYRTNEIDHAIALRSLEAMKDRGRAVLIVGSINKLATTDKARRDAYNGKAKREFYYRLYSEYNVTDHFTVAGELYAKQGAGWPVDVIVIEGRGKSALPLPAVQAPRQFDSWDGLETELAGRERVQSQAGAQAPDAAGSVGRPAGGYDRAGGSGGAGRADRRPQRPAAEQPGRVPDGLADGEPGGGRLDERPARNDAAPAQDERNQRDRRAPAVEREPVAGENERQVTYHPASGAQSLDTLVPVNMQTAISKALDALQDRVGPVDSFVANRLGYDPAEIGNVFSAEQVDALALAISNMEAGAGFIIGDQTGIGKGRVNAGVIRYAMKSGRMPIFVTEKPGLYADMYRDMTDIGIPEMLGRKVNIVMTNASEKVPLTEDGSEVLKSGPTATHNALLNRIANGERGNVDVLFTTYSQMQSLKGEWTERQRAIEALAKGAIVMFDESHNAGGQGPDTGRKSAKQKAAEEAGTAGPSRAQFARDIAKLAHGVFYSSATYAKRPEVMDLYASTDMRLAVADINNLAGAISKGGIPMQQVVASTLTEAGQYVRRERSFDGVAYNTPSVDVDRDAYSQFTRVLAGIQDFQEQFVKDAVDAIAEEIRAEAKAVSFDGSVGGAGATSTNFTAVMHNLVEQMLLSMKAAPAAERAIAAIQAGEKPVITVANTMGAFLEEYATENDIGHGQPVPIDFRGLLIRYLERTRRITLKKPFSAEKGEVRYLTDEDIGAEGARAFAEVRQQIDDMDLGTIPLSPIDYITQQINDAGYRVGEITGRKVGLDYSGDVPTFRVRAGSDTSTAGKRKPITGFNNGDIDAMILNQSGSTGISLHASSKFKDQRKRKMIIAQAEKNIDTHMQMLGRVHRTGQVVLPEYDQLVAAVPAEMRPAAVLAKKMASLNANTTGARDSALTAEDVPDFMNEYGDEVAARIMDEDASLRRRLALALTGGSGDEEGFSRDGAARKVTGRLMLLPLDEQEAFYERFLQDYRDYLQEKEAAGEATLEAKTLPLDAKVITSEQVLAPTHATSPFGAGVELEVLDVKRLGKPMEPDDVLQAIADGLGIAVPEGRQSAAYDQLIAAGRQAGMALRDKYTSAFDVYRRTVMDDMTGDKLSAMDKRLTANRAAFVEVSNLVYPGAAIGLENADGDTVNGVVLAIEKKGDPKNPLAMGSFRATIALADASNKVNIPFSQMRGGRTEATPGTRLVYPISRIEGVPVLQAFAEAQVVAREKRVMFTGNILAAYEHTGGKGQIVNFISENGSVHAGIMMKRGFDYDKQIAKQPVAFRTPGQVLAWLQLGHAAIADNVSVERQGERLIVTTAAAKSVGGRYFLDAAVRRAIGGDFFKKSTGMVAETTMANANAVVAALQSAGATFRAKDNLDAARDIVANEGAKQSIAQGKPVAVLTGDELGIEMRGPEDMDALREAAREYYNREFIGTTVTSSDGHEVAFSKRALRKVTSKGDQLIRAIPAIRAIIERGELIDTRPGRDVGTKAMHLYAADVSVGGDVRRLGVFVRETSDGRFQYDLTSIQEGVGSRSVTDGDGAAAPFAPALEGAPDNLNLVEVAGDFKSVPQWAAAKAEIGVRLSRLGVADKVKIAITTLIDDDVRIAGSYQNGLITIALNSAQRGSMTVDHEAVHAMKALGLFRDAEWTALANGARADGPLMQSVRERYPNLSGEALIEEAIADRFMRYAKGAEERGFVRTAFERAIEFVKSLRQALRGQGFLTAESVMRSIEGGEIGAREPGELQTGPRKEAVATEEVTLSDTDPTWRGKSEEALDTWRTRMQDRYLPLLKTQRKIEEMTGQPLPTSANPYLGEELMSGRIGAQLETLADKHVSPLFEAMQAEGVSQEELETYLYARHAPERNARMSEINPEIADGTGSGMTDLQAAAVMTRIRKAGQMDAMERLAARVDELRDMAVDTRVNAGLMSQDQADEWRSTYEHYVPLRGFREVGGDPAVADHINRSGGGINVRGRESRAAYGRRSQADSILAYTILQAEEAIVRAETNRVAQRFVNLARKAPDDSFWQVNKVASKQRVNEESGLVERYIDRNLQAEDKDWTVSAKFNGREVRVTMNRENASARRLADSMRNLTQHQLDFITLHLGKVNRFLSAVNTSWNPEFVITNAIRDLEAASINLAGVGRDGLTGAVLKLYPGAAKAAMKGAWGKEEGEWGRWYREFTEAGGRVYFNQVEDVAQIKKRINDTIAMSAAKAGDGNALLYGKRALIAIRDTVENTNLGVENAVRLATFRAAREAGMSRDQAASVAKNITVNFNRRGTFGPAMNAAYLFYNAGVQGTARILMAMRSPRVRKTMYAVVATSFMLELLNAMAAGVDDDGESYYDKISPLDKSRNIIISLGGSEFLKIPMPYGYNVFANAGRTLAEIARRGGSRWEESAAEFISSAMDAFNPVGGGNSLLNFFAPTILDPVVDLSTNRDFAGKPIMPDEKQFGPQDPDHTRYWGSVSPVWRSVSSFLNNATGGDDVVGGAIDVSPETFEYLAGTVIGAAGGFVDRTASLGAKAIAGEDVTVNDVPFARKVIGTKNSWYDKSAYYDRVAQVEDAVKRTKDYLDAEQGDEAANFADRNERVLSLERDVKAAKRDMREIRKARRANQHAFDLGKIDKATYQAEADLVNGAEKDVITSFNRRWNEAMDDGED